MAYNKLFLQNLSMKDVMRGWEVGGKRNKG